MMMRINDRIWRESLTVLALLAALALPNQARAYFEPKFDLLQIGTQTLTNATVTSTNSRTIFVSHAGGLGSFKVADLSPELREKLGYFVAKPKTNTVVNWTKAHVGKFSQKELTKVREELEARVPIPIVKRIPVDPITLGSVFGALVAVYFLFCYCCMLICRKSGAEPGFLVWLPIVQMFPLVRAAGMSPLWALAFLVPGLNIVAHVLWCFKIAQARGKSPACAMALVLPVINLAAFLYLAFSGAAPKEEEPKASRSLVSLKPA